MSTELSQYKSYKDGEEYFGQFATVPRILDVVCTSPLVTPKWVTTNFTIKKADGTVVNIQTTAPIVETGFKVDVELVWKWVHNDAYADPDSTAFSAATDTFLPVSNVNSSTFTRQNITATTSFIRYLYRTITAPSVDTTNKILLKPTGKEKLTTQVGISVSFRHRTFFGKTTNSAPTNKTDLVQVGSYTVDRGLVSSRVMTVTGITTGGTEYLCYMYPKALGALSDIIQDGATPITDAFIRTETNILNDAGVTIAYYVYTSKNKGAFNNAKIEFK